MLSVGQSHNSVSTSRKEQFDFKLIRGNDKPIIVLNWVDLKTLLAVLAVLGLNLNSAVDCVCIPLSKFTHVLES